MLAIEGAPPPHPTRILYSCQQFRRCYVGYRTTEKFWTWSVLATNARIYGQGNASLETDAADSVNANLCEMFSFIARNYEGMAESSAGQRFPRCSHSSRQSVSLSFVVCLPKNALQIHFRHLLWRRHHPEPVFVAPSSFDALTAWLAPRMPRTWPALLLPG